MSVTMGRKSDYTEELGDRICDLIAEGDSLREICEHDSMPDRQTVRRWMDARPEFAAKYVRARDLQADAMDDKIKQVADTCTNETALADRVRIGAYQWRAAKLAPKRYGDRQQVAAVDLDGNAVQMAPMLFVGVSPKTESGA